jgi:predicted nucleotide-binding protein
LVFKTWLNIILSWEIPMSDTKSNSLLKLKDGVSIDKAREQINVQIEKGRVIRDQDIKNRDDLEKIAWKDKERWHDDNIRLLILIFDNESVVDKHYYFSFGIELWGDKPLYEDIKYFRETINRYMENLKSILEEQERIYQLEQELKDPIMDTTSKQKVFVVHGHDPIKDQLESLLLRWGFDPIILADQVSQGLKTIIEKFEANSDVKCAIVLLTPDDEGHLKGDNDLKSRARQNVIFELGFFIAKLGRDRIICLQKGDIEIPSDIGGILPITFGNDLKSEIYQKLHDELIDMGFTING